MFLKVMLDYAMIVQKMRIKKSEEMNGWIGFFGINEFGHPEEFMSVKTIDTAKKIVDRLQKDIENLKPSDNNDLSKNCSFCNNGKRIGTKHSEQYCGLCGRKLAILR